MFYMTNLARKGLINISSVEISNMYETQICKFKYDPFLFSTVFNYF